MRASVEQHTILRRLLSCHIDSLAATRETVMTSEKPKSEEGWAYFPYDKHRVVMKYMTDGRELIPYIEAFQHCKTIGDLTGILKVKRLTGMRDIDVWPTLRIEDDLQSAEGFAEALSVTAIYGAKFSCDGLDWEVFGHIVKTGKIRTFENRR